MNRMKPGDLVRVIDDDLLVHVIEEARGMNVWVFCEDLPFDLDPRTRVPPISFPTCLRCVSLSWQR